MPHDSLGGVILVQKEQRHTQGEKLPLIFRIYLDGCRQVRQRRLIAADLVIVVPEVVKRRWVVRFLLSQVFQDGYSFVVQFARAQCIAKCVLSYRVSGRYRQAVMKQHDVVCPVNMLISGRQPQRTGEHQRRESLNWRQPCQLP